MPVGLEVPSSVHSVTNSGSVADSGDAVETPHAPIVADKRTPVHKVVDAAGDALWGGGVENACEQVDRKPANAIAPRSLPSCIQVASNRILLGKIMQMAGPESHRTMSHLGEGGQLLPGLSEAIIDDAIQLAKDQLLAPYLKRATRHLDSGGGLRRVSITEDLTSAFGLLTSADADGESNFPAFPGQMASYLLGLVDGEPIVPRPAHAANFEGDLSELRRPRRQGAGVQVQPLTLICEIVGELQDLLRAMIPRAAVESEGFNLNRYLDLLNLPRSPAATGGDAYSVLYYDEVVLAYHSQPLHYPADLMDPLLGGPEEVWEYPDPSEEQHVTMVSLAAVPDPDDAGLVRFYVRIAEFQG